jgi:phenylacetate-coenzyme A ligase PaaK-like adenylate-forming protein
VTFDELIALPPYSLSAAEKNAALLDNLNDLTRHHRRNCPEYDRLLRVLHPSYGEARSLADVPFLPVGLFKSHRLLSVPPDKVFKTLTSSGTTGQQVSQIVLDHETARRQTVALSRIMTHVLGPARLPMMLIESAGLIKDRSRFSARAAGVLGMANFGRNHFYALDDGMALDEAGVAGFLEKHGSQPFLIFGFTFMVWQYLYERVRGRGFDLSSGILVHSGGWKKLQDRAIANADFRRLLKAETGLTRIYNFYGMVEQVGSVFLEGEDGYLYPPNFSDVIIRDPRTWEEVGPGTPGIIQLVSLLPLSYPGHSILTEDMGMLHAPETNGCGRQGKPFSVMGRVPKAALRGCSDTHEAPEEGR